MDASNPKATTVAEYLQGTPSFRTDLYSSCGTVLSHRESIELLRDLGVKYTPELKAASVAMPFQGVFTQEMYAQKMLDEYKNARIAPSQVFAQSFNLNDVLYWLAHEPRFGRQAVYLDDRVDAGRLEGVALRVRADEGGVGPRARGALARQRQHRLGDVDAGAVAAGAQRARHGKRGAAGTAAHVEHGARGIGGNAGEQQILERLQHLIERGLRLHPRLPGRAVP